VTTVLSAALAVLLAASVAAAQDEPLPEKLELDVRELELDVRELDYPTEEVEGGAQAVDGQVEQLAVQETETEVRIELSGDVLFDFDRATLRPAAEPTLEQVAAVIARYGDPQVRIDGYTDAKGSDAYNLTLSQKRADAVKQWLAAHGVTEGVTTKGWGEANPVAPNEKPDGSDDPEGRQKNRRVQITVQKG
jgi:outer membrane protein OmpA-like peptidoglycan-associated protein